MYVIERDRWNINSDGRDARATTEGLNNAMNWAVSQGFNHMYLPQGRYAVAIDPSTLTAINMVSDMHFEMDKDTVIALEGNSSPQYTIFELKYCTNSKVSGGRIIGDKEAHQYELLISFERGGVNADGSLNDDPNWIRSEVLDRYAHPGLLSRFRLWTLDGVNATTYHFYQYKDRVGAGTLVGSRSDGRFAPAAPTGRGWFADTIAENNKMIIAIPNAGAQLSDAQIAELRGRIDNFHYTHEAGHGIGVFASSYIEIANVEVSHCTGDGIITGRADYYLDPEQYTEADIGKHIIIRDCDIHHCRRQGISLCAPNDVYVFRNTIHHIGYADDGVTTNERHGIPPMYGIDIESMVGETNIPIKTPENPDGLELNYRIYIKENHIHHNARGHFVNVDGTDVTLTDNTFEGSNIGGVNSHFANELVKFINNTFIDCELWVQGDNVVDGAIFKDGNLRFLNVNGAVVSNCTLQDGRVYGSSVYGYFGTPTVSVADHRFTFDTPHQMGNGAQVVFEQWIGKVPSGISVDKIYYTVNVTANSFQVAEELGGSPVQLIEAGQPGFNISRFNYGRCYISNITVEREWRADNASTPNFTLLAAGAVLNNIVVKNYDIRILVPANYAGRPNLIKGLTLIEGSMRIEGSHLSGGQFIRAKTGLMGNTDIQIGSNDARYRRNIVVEQCYFQDIGVVLEGNQSVIDCTFIDADVSKANNDNKAVVAQSFLDNTRINLHWLNKENSALFVGNIYKHVTLAGQEPYVRHIEVTDISQF